MLARPLLRSSSSFPYARDLVLTEIQSTFCLDANSAFKPFGFRLTCCSFKPRSHLSGLDFTISL
uniref:Uncharacterized protein n=1 Tax=Schistosoma japonicum TaxID=6182 RepID=Q5C207_SCHJA|nr:unknown [Schistosoma japonicum]